ncbi:ku70/Ku80 beta-barrel domain-containing protein [Phthorimaea operculella]|nr:ku70/Ku80 beta-barrel domain-containing protein [Phthorimaea operculella]
MDSDEEQDTNVPGWKGVPGTVILINVFDTSRDTASIAHAATCRMVRQYLRTQSSNIIGVCLYGTEDSSTSVFGTKSVVEVFPLTTPTLDDYKKLRGLDLSSYQPAKEFKLSDVIWHCSKMFTNCKKQLSSKSVIMLTRLDTPPIQSDQKPTYLRVGDLVDSNIDIKIINISEDDYKVDTFYENFLNQANKGRGFVLPKPVADAKEVEKVMHQQAHRHLAVARLKLHIGDGFEIGVGVYNLLIRSTYQKSVYLEKESNALVSSVTKTMKVSTDIPTSSHMDVDDEENEPSKVPLLKSELLHYVVYGGERVEVTDNEMKNLKNPFGPPALKLLGFKPAEIMCKEKWFFKGGYFLFPNEDKIEGSTVAFKALHQACVETKMVAICILCTRVNAKPVTVALSPCTHPLGLDVEIGFDVVQIPFVENVRDLPPPEEEGEVNISNVQKNLMKEIIQKLQCDYKPDMFENPTLQSKYRALEAIALDEDDLDPFVDTTKPAPEVFEGIKDNIFDELFGPFEPTVSKRAAGSAGGGSNAKKLKGEDINDNFVMEQIKSRNVHKFTVAQLRDILTEKKYGNPNIPALTGLKKNELVDLVYKYCK